MLRDFGQNLAYLVLGSLVCAYAVNGILIPKHFVTGGFTGLALVLRSLLPGTDTGVLYAAVNVPVFLLAWFHLGRRFIAYSLMGGTILALAFAFVRPAPVPVEDLMLSALLAGLLSGVGSGIILRSRGSAGGAEMLGIILQKRCSFDLGNTILAVNCLVLCLTGVFYSLEAVLYTLVLLYVRSKVINIVVTGLSQRKAVHIISKQWEAIRQEILKDTRWGVTILHGEGGYSREREQVLYLIVTFNELYFLKGLLRKIDPHAFMVVRDTLEVMNERIGNQPHW